MKQKSLHFEQLLLGALTLQPKSIDRIEGIISPEKFSVKEHFYWYQAIYNRIEKKQEIDIFLLASDLDRPDIPRPRGKSWLTYIGDIVANTPSASNIVSYANMVDRFYRERQLVLLGESIVQVLKDPSLDIDARISEAERLISEINTQPNEGVLHVSDALGLAIENLEKRFESGGKIEMPYGFSELDELTHGAQRGDLVYIAGRPGMGKTALGMNIASHFCDMGLAGLICSLEMSSEQLASRLITSIGQVDASRFRSGKLLDEDWERVTYALSKMVDYRLLIDETPLATPMSIRSAAKRAKRELQGLDFIMVDYLQLMQIDHKDSRNRYEEITEISRQMKMIAREFNVPVFVLAQLNRNLEQRANRRPVMSDLRESGAIEQDADLILFLYRDEVYNPDSEYKGMAEIIVGKQRNGPTGVVKTAFLGDYSKFMEWSR